MGDRKFRWLERLPVTQEAAGSSPVAPAILIRGGMKTLHVMAVTQCSPSLLKKSCSCGSLRKVLGLAITMLKAASSQLDHVRLVLFHALYVTAQVDVYFSLAQWSSRVSCTHSPPGLESLTTTILRI